MVVQTLVFDQVFRIWGKLKTANSSPSTVHIIFRMPYLELTNRPTDSFRSTEGRSHTNIGSSFNYFKWFQAETSSFLIWSVFWKLRIWKYLLKIKPNDTESVLQTINYFWKTLMNSIPLSYSRLNESINRVSWLMRSFSYFLPWSDENTFGPLLGISKLPVFYYFIGVHFNCFNKIMLK